MKQILLISFMLFSMQAFCQHSSLKVVMIRHGEKNDATGNLSCKGLHRAMALPAVLNAKFEKPTRIYAPSLSDKKVTGHARMLQTITPFAVQDSLAIDTEFDVDKTSALATEIKTKKGVILVVWEHGNIPGIAKQLGITTPNLQWGSTDFDSIWIVTYAKVNGKWVTTLSTDKEGLNPSSACNF